MASQRMAVSFVIRADEASGIPTSRPARRWHLLPFAATRAYTALGVGHGE